MNKKIVSLPHVRMLSNEVVNPNCTTRKIQLKFNQDFFLLQKHLFVYIFIYACQYIYTKQKAITNHKPDINKKEKCFVYTIFDSISTQSNLYRRSKYKSQDVL